VLVPPICQATGDDDVSCVWNSLVIIGFKMYGYKNLVDVCPFGTHHTRVVNDPSQSLTQFVVVFYFIGVRFDLHLWKGGVFRENFLQFSIEFLHAACVDLERFGSVFVSKVRLLNLTTKDVTVFVLVNVVPLSSASHLFLVVFGDSTRFCFDVSEGPVHPWDKASICCFAPIKPRV
jgi:hypothetical protein